MTVAVYYFPNYHQDTRNHQIHGAGWNEWELVKNASPRFPGHRQPRIPLWGYEDESDPVVMARKIDAAADHGVDVFLFDWYWYNDGQFLEKGLEQGFLQAANNNRLQFGIMWANHDWIDIHPARLFECRQNDHRLLYAGKVNREAFERATDYVIEHYFKHPSYWKIGGAPYFSFYDLSLLLQSLGGVESTRQALASFRAKTIAAGFPDLHLNQVLWNYNVLPGESRSNGAGVMLKSLGYNSFTSYVWIHHVAMEQFPQTNYLDVFQKYLEYWERITGEMDLPYYPNLTMGWDSTPRTTQSEVFENAGYPFTPILKDNTPENFHRALEEINKRMNSLNIPILTINAWNEWTEGSYLEPDTHYGTAYLEAIRDVFGNHNADRPFEKIRMIKD